MRSAPLAILLSQVKSASGLMAPRLVFDPALVDVVDGVAVYDEAQAVKAVQHWTGCKPATAAALVEHHAREAKAKLRVKAP